MKDTSALLISTTLGWISATEGHLSEDEVVLIQYWASLHILLGRHLQRIKKRRRLKTSGKKIVKTDVLALKPHTYIHSEVRVKYESRQQQAWRTRRLKYNDALDYSVWGFQKTGRRSIKNCAERRALFLFPIRFEWLYCVEQSGYPARDPPFSQWPGPLG